MQSNKTTAAVRTPLTGALEWIDRYADAVAQQLPIKQRGDIQLEVRSLLLDEIEQVAPSGAPTEAQVLALLKRYPSPNEMAARYGATQSLIGPRYYHSYVTVLTLVLTIVLVLNVIAIIAGAFTGEPSFSLFGMLGSLMSGLFVSGGIVTLIFAAIERSGASLDDDNAEGWSPEKLPQVSQPNRVAVGDMIWNIVWTLVLLVWLNFYVSNDGTMPVYIGEWTELPVFSALFVSFIPWLSLIWAGELIVEIVALAQRSWNMLTRTLAILFGLAGIGVMTWMLNAGALGGSPAFEPWVRGFMVVAIIVTVFEVGSHVWAIIKSVTNRPTNVAPNTFAG